MRGKVKVDKEIIQKRSTYGGTWPVIRHKGKYVHYITKKPIEKFGFEELAKRLGRILK